MKWKTCGASATTINKITVIKLQFQRSGRASVGETRAGLKNSLKALICKTLYVSLRIPNRYVKLIYLFNTHKAVFGLEKARMGAFFSRERVLAECASQKLLLLLTLEVENVTETR